MFAGDIVAVAGLPEIMIGDTLADPDHAHALPRITVDEPAISVTIGTNTSPLAGKVSGHKLTARMVKSRLDTELVGNVSIRVVDIGRPDAWEVQGRGELALAVLVEEMRPGTADRLGVGFAAMHELNPRLVYCSISGFGQDGPYATLPDMT